MVASKNSEPRPSSESDIANNKGKSLRLLTEGVCLKDSKTHVINNNIRLAYT